MRDFNFTNCFYSVSSIFVLVLVLMVPTAVQAELLRAIVVDFTSSTTTNYTKRLPELIIDELVNSGEFDVLEREKLTSMARELSFQAGALVDPGKAVEIGNMSGGQIMVTGNIIENTNSRNSSSSYGITSTIRTYYLKSRIEVIDLQTGSKILSHIADDQAILKSTGPNSVGRGEDSIGPAVALKHVKNILENKRIRAMIDSTNGNEAGPVTMSVESEPNGADVEIDGVFLGNAGNTFQLTPGVHTVSISLPGYEIWEKQVKVTNGLSFKANLTRIVDERIEITVDDKIGE